MHRILVTGVETLLGAYTAHALSQQPHTRVVALGRAMPVTPVGAAEILIAQLNADQLAELLRVRRIETLVVIDSPGEEWPARDRPNALRRVADVLMAAIEARVPRIVVRSHTCVYGADPEFPRLLREDQAFAPEAHAPLQQHYRAIERFCGEVRRLHPQQQVLIVRCAPLLGGGGWTVLSRYLCGPAPRTVLGFAPMIQFLHPADAANVLKLAALSDLDGALNVAGPSMLVGQAIALAGRRALPLMRSLTSAAEMMRTSSQLLGGWPFDVATLCFGMVVDTQRLKTELRWRPEHSPVELTRSLQTVRPWFHERNRSEVALRAFLNRK